MTRTDRDEHHVVSVNVGWKEDAVDFMDDAIDADVVTVGQISLVDGDSPLRIQQTVKWTLVVQHFILS